MMLPMLDLRTRSGEPLSWLPLWQRHNLLVLVADRDCEECLRVLDDWDEQAAVLKAENTVPIAIFEEDPGSFPGVIVIGDPERRFAETVGVGSGTVLAVDRFFEVLDQEDVHGRRGPDFAACDAIGWVKLAERTCPECGVGTW